MQNPSYCLHPDPSTNPKTNPHSHTAAHTTNTSANSSRPRSYLWRLPSRSTRGRHAVFGMQQVPEDVLQYPVLRRLSALPRIGAIGALAHPPTPKPPRVYPVPLPSISVNACSIVCSKKDDEPKGPIKMGTSACGVRRTTYLLSLYLSGRCPTRNASTIRSCRASISTYPENKR